jgi:hypothetical protein
MWRYSEVIGFPESRAREAAVGHRNGEGGLSASWPGLSAAARRGGRCRRRGGRRRRRGRRAAGRRRRARIGGRPLGGGGRLAVSWSHPLCRGIETRRSARSRGPAHGPAAVSVTQSSLWRCEPRGRWGPLGAGGEHPRRQGERERGEAGRLRGRSHRLLPGLAAVDSLVGYSLDIAHEKGGPKASGFERILGITAD